MNNLIIGIAGGTGSGKTTIAKALQEKLSKSDSLIIKQDSYYKDLSHIPYKERISQNFDHPNSFDIELLVNHIERLKNKKNISAPDYDFTKHIRRQKKISCKPKKIILVEGIFAIFFSSLRKLYTFNVFLDIPPDIRLIRRINRDMNNRDRSIKSVTKQYLDTVRPMHNQFVEPSKNYADIIIDNDKSIESIIEALMLKIKSVSL